MKNILFILGCLCLGMTSNAQTSIQGQIKDDKASAVSFANVILYASADSSMIKVETTDEAGVFKFGLIPTANYYMKATYVGLPDLVLPSIDYTEGEIIDLGILSFASASLELSEITVKANRSLVEVKSDRTVFNVEGTVNSVGADAITLLRKAPSVTVDNNDNISVLGRTGVLVYIDGKRLPLAGDDLSSYLKNMTAEQIDRIDIITNPGAKYDAEGNAGIIDIRLKKDKNIGTNGSLSGSFSQGDLTRYNINGSGNYRNKKLNVFAVAGYGVNDNYHNIIFGSHQNGLFLDEINDSSWDRNFYNLRLGTDFFVSNNSTVGFLYSGRKSFGTNESYNRIAISQEDQINNIDSILIATNENKYEKNQNSINLNYSYSTKERSFNIDLDYGSYKNASDRFQPNQYFDGLDMNLLSEKISKFTTPTDIDIYTGKVDYEDSFYGGKIGAGVKFSRVTTKNEFSVFDVENGIEIFNNAKSNLFDYDEDVYAAYVSYSRALSDKMNFSSGLRVEQTEAKGVLTAYLVDLQEPPVKLSYLRWFPSVGLTYAQTPNHSFAMNYGRRINRPDYSVLNPFNNQKSELSLEKGNPFLRPEIVNNIELGYTYAFRFNFKLAYSVTKDQITRIIGPDENDPRAGFISWDNLATQKVLGFNASLPFQFGKKWNAFFNLSASHIDNQADYGDKGKVDVQVFTYTIFQQHTITLPKGFNGEISGYFSGPGVWGGVFVYEESWALNLGLQKKFFADKLNVKLTANDIFKQSGWNGVSKFNGLTSFGQGNWDSRNISVNLSYNFGNKNVKSRKRKTGLEDESKRVGN